MALFIISKDRQTQVIAANAMATTIISDYNSRFPYHFHQQSVPLLLLVIILRTIELKYAIWEQFDYCNQKQTKSYVLTWTSCPQLRFRARDLHALLCLIAHQSRI